MIDTWDERDDGWLFAGNIMRCQYIENGIAQFGLWCSGWFVGFWLGI